MITKDRYNSGSGGVWVLSAPETEALALEAEVLQTLQGIDKWSSPTIESRSNVDGVLTVKVKYYGLD